MRGSLTGSVIGNLLLVLGFSLLVGGRGEHRPRVELRLVRADRHRDAALPGRRDPGLGRRPGPRLARHLSVPVSIALLVRLRRGDVVLAAAAPATARREPTTRSRAWSFRSSLVVLGVATVATALVAEILVGSLEVFAENAGLSDFFVAAVIVAIVGNAAEHGGAVIVAYRGKIKLAAEIALSSAAQVAVFLIPAVDACSRG